MKIHTFNTGRLYSTHGQRIAYCELLRDYSHGSTTILVAFHDLDRGMTEVIRMPPEWGWVQDQEAMLMNRYDACDYLRMVQVSQDVENALKEAAQACAPVSP